MDIKSLARQYFQRLLNEKDLSVCEEMLSPDYIDHDAPPDAPRGPQGTREFVAGFLETYPDMHVEIEELLAEGNKAALRMVWLGHHRQTGATFHQVGNIFLCFDEKGQIVERWSAYQAL
jgi:predicted SnoaL-like aldol condensation-catalyzing enzyme